MASDKISQETGIISEIEAIISRVLALAEDPRNNHSSNFALTTAATALGDALAYLPPTNLREAAIQLTVWGSKVDCLANPGPMINPEHEAGQLFHRMRDAIPFFAQAAGIDTAGAVMGHFLVPASPSA